MTRFLPLLLTVRLALALLVSSCGLRLTDEAVRVAALRHDYTVRVPQTCGCGALADADRMHGLVSKQAPSKTATHQAINDVTALAVTSAGIPVTRSLLALQDLTAIDAMPRQRIFNMGRDRDVVLADFYYHALSYFAGSAAEITSLGKVEIFPTSSHLHLPTSHIRDTWNMKLVWLQVSCGRSAYV